MKHETQLQLFDPDLSDTRGGPTPRLLDLRTFYNEVFLPDSKALAPNTLQKYRTAIGHWESCVKRKSIDSIGRADVRRFRDEVVARGELQASSINSNWRHLYAILNYAFKEEYIDRVPTAGRRMSTKLVEETRPPQRDPLTIAEMERLFAACEAATWPNRSVACLSWRVFILLQWLYGPRTRDLVGMTWSSIDLKNDLVRFCAMKTRKVQALPLHPAARYWLEQIGPGKPAEEVFPGFSTVGYFNSKSKKWNRGMRTTWRCEILPRAELAGIHIKLFRQSMVTRHNASQIYPNLGSWIAGHYMPGVSAKNYEMPTEPIRRAIAASEIPPSWLPPAAAERKQPEHAARVG